MKTVENLLKGEKEMLERARALTESIPVNEYVDDSSDWRVVVSLAAISRQLTLLIEIILREI